MHSLHLCVLLFFAVVQSSTTRPFSVDYHTPHSRQSTDTLGLNPNDFLNLWPRPNQITFGTTTLNVVPTEFEFKPVGIASTSSLLSDAFARYFKIMFAWGNSSNNNGTLFSEVYVEVDSIDENLQMDMDESYILKIDSSIGHIYAPQIWGVLHALETLSQLVEWNFTTHSYNVRFAPYSIEDKPRFPWRGLLVDTARHFLSLDTLLRTIDGLSYNKMNVLHWHASDAESMPIDSELFPNLALKGAYTPTAIYTHNDVKKVIEYGRKRGVRVMPEFDMPGHNYAYGLGVPNLILNCPIAQPAETEFWAASFDPTSENVYTFLEIFLGEMAVLFPDSVLHVGGDEVVYDCWNETQTILDYMKVNNITNLSDLYVMFEHRVHKILSTFQKTPMAWDEVFTTASSVLPPNAIVQVWRGDSTLTKVIQKGFRTVSSSDYYLNAGFDVSPHYIQWTDIYNRDPMPAGLTPAQQKLMLGAEACVWGEEVNDFNIDQRLWFRGNVFAERLWSNTMSDLKDVQMRVIKQNCRLIQRGINCTPFESRDIFPRRDLRRVCELLLPPKVRD